MSCYMNLYALYSSQLAFFVGILFNSPFYSFFVCLYVCECMLFVYEYSVCSISIWMGTVSSLESILVDVTLYAVCMHTHAAISTYMLDSMLFFCVYCSNKPSPHPILRLHILFFILFNLIAEVDGQEFSLVRLVRFSSAFACPLFESVQPVRQPASQCIQHYVCTLKMLFIYCNLVTRHFVNVDDIFTFIKKL